MRREMRQLVETNERDLRALPGINRAVELQVRELDPAGTRPAPLAHCDMRDPAEARVKVLALIPQPAGIGDLRGRAAEKHGGEIRHPRGVAQRFQDQPDGFSATRGTAIDADVGRTAKKLGLPTGLRRDGGRDWGDIAHVPSPESTHSVFPSARYGLTIDLAVHLSPSVFSRKMS